MDQVLAIERRRRNLRMVLFGIILVTLPFYCAGCLLWSFAPQGSASAPTQGAPTASFTPMGLPTGLPTNTPFGLITPIIGTATPFGALQPTPGQFFPPVVTRFLSPTPFLFPTLTLAPTLTPFPTIPTSTPFIPTATVFIPTATVFAPTAEPPTATLFVPTAEPPTPLPFPTDTPIPSGP